MIKLSNVLKTIVDVLDVVIRAKRSSLLFFFAINVRQQQNAQSNHKFQDNRENNHQKRKWRQNDNKSIDDNRQFESKSFESDRRKDIAQKNDTIAKRTRRAISATKLNTSSRIASSSTKKKNSRKSISFVETSSTRRNLIVNEKSSRIRSTRTISKICNTHRRCRESTI